MVFYGLILPVLFCAGLILVDTDQRTAVLLIMLGWGLSVLTSGRYSKWLYMMFMPLIIYGCSCISWAAAAPDPAAGSGNYILWLGSAFLFIAALFPLYFEYKLFAFPAGLCAIALWLSPMIQMANIDITHYIELVFTGLFTAGAVLGLIGILLYISLIFRDGDFRYLIPKSLLALVLGILPIAASYATTWFIVPEWVPATLAGGIFLIIGFIMYRRDTNGAEGVQFSLLPLFLTGSLYLTGLASVDTSSLRIPFSYGELAMTKLAGSGILTKAGEVINVLLNSVISLIRPLVTYNFRDSGKTDPEEKRLTPDKRSHHNGEIFFINPLFCCHLTESDIECCRIGTPDGRHQVARMIRVTEQMNIVCLHCFIQRLIGCIADGYDHRICRYFLYGLMYALQTHDKRLAVGVRNVGCRHFHNCLAVFILQYIR